MSTALPQRYARLQEIVSNARSLLLVTHERADGDAIGSLVAFRETVGPNVRIELLAPKASLEQFSYLEGTDRIAVDAGSVSVDRHDVVIMLDCGDVVRTSVAEKIFFLGPHRPTVVVIDHHPTTTAFRGRDFVDLAIVRTGTSSTCELLYGYFRHNGISISPIAATAMLTGIVTDTGGFQNLGTTLEAMEIAGELMKYGGNLRRVVSATMRNKTVDTLRLWGRAMSRLEHDPSTRLVTTALMLKDFDECGVSAESAEGVANFLNGLGEGDAVLVLREEAGGMVKGSFRTKKDGVDVAAMAKRYGGGGHTKAAGFTVYGTISRASNGWSIENLRERTA